MGLPFKYPLLPRPTPLKDAASRFKLRFVDPKKRYVVMVGNRAVVQEDDVFIAKRKYKEMIEKYGKKETVALWDGDRRLEASLPAGAE
jgi:hypothetical protein